MAYKLSRGIGKDNYFVYFNPNPKQLTGVGDCTIRALCAVTGFSWYEVWDRVMAGAREACMFPNFKPFEVKRMEMFGLKKGVIPRPKKGEKSTRVQDFCKAHPIGRYVLTTAHHEIGVVDGKYYDTCVNSGHKVYSYWELENWK